MAERVFPNELVQMHLRIHNKDENCIVTRVCLTTPAISKLLDSGDIATSAKVVRIMENSKEEVVVITNVEQAVLPMLEDEDVHTNKSPTSTSKASNVEQAVLPMLEDEDVHTNKSPTSTSKASTSTSKAPTSTSKAPTSTSQTQTQWNQRYEKFLLDTYKTFEESKKPIKNKWGAIADLVNKELDVKFTGEQCRLKIKCLKEKFDRHQKKLNKSGEEHTEMPPELEIFESQPDVKPVITMDSFKCDKGKRQHEDNGIDVSSEEEEDRSIKPDPKKAKLCPTPNELQHDPFSRYEWKGSHHHCVGEMSCRKGFIQNIMNRQTGTYNKNPWAFTRIMYLLLFPKTTPRYLILKKDPYKYVEYKFHPGCRNGC